MATEWGRTTFLTTKDVKIRIKWYDTSGVLHTLGTMPDFTFNFWIENRESTKLTATKVGEMLTNCYINEEDGYLYINIPKTRLRQEGYVNHQNPYLRIQRLVMTRLSLLLAGSQFTDTYKIHYYGRHWNN